MSLDKMTSNDALENTSIGMTVLDWLNDYDADADSNAAVKAWNDVHMKIWQKRAGLDAIGIPDAQAEGDDVGNRVAIGNEIHNHYESKAAAPPTAQPPVTTTPPVVPSVVPAVANGLGTLGKAALIAALTGGTGLGGVMIGNWLSGGAPAIKSIDTDTDTRSTLRPYLGNEN